MSAPNDFPARALLSHLVPVPVFLSAFTTSTHLANSNPNLTILKLNDKELGVHKVSSKTPKRLVVEPPSTSCLRLASNLIPNEVVDEHGSFSALPPPTLAWEALYPKGSINPSSVLPGGFGFYLAGPASFAKDLETAVEAVFGYRMMLQDGDDQWEWVKGGKLPGIYGGEGDRAYGCTGGRQEERCKCFNLRPMWRPNSIGELYAYLPLTAQNATQLAAVPPKSVENSDYGFSVGRGAYSLQQAVGRWVAVAFRVRLNDVGIDNGEIEMWIDGESVIKVDGLRLRETEAGKIKGMHFQTFFGGHTPEWASPKDQKAWFADVTGAIIR